MKRTIAAAGVLGTLLLSACGGETTPTVNGRWSGSATSASLGLVTLTLTLSESENGAITGSGNIVDGENVAVTVTGTHADPNVSMNLSLGAQFEAINFAGQFVGDNTITGTLNGSGFTNFAMTLRKTG